MGRPHRLLLFTWGFCIASYVGLWGFMAFFGSLGQFTELWPETMLLFAITFGLAAFSHGFIRACIHNPFQNKGYREWLLAMPWTPDKALPTGRQYPVWTDVLLLVILVFLAYLHGVPMPSHLFMLMCLGYSIAYIPLFILHGQQLPLYMWLYSGLMLITLYILNSPLLLISILILVPLLLLSVTLFTLKKLYRLFSYYLDFQEYDYLMNIFLYNKKPPLPGFKNQRNIESAKLIQSLTGKSREHLGFPLFVLLPQALPALLHRKDKVLLSLAGGWGAALYSYVNRGNSENLTILFSIFLLLALFSRLPFIANMKSPINLLGRLFTGRLIIPGYDRIFFPTLLSSTVLYVLLYIINSINIFPSIAAGVAYGIAIFILCTTEPSLHKQQLTGPCRLVNIPLTNRRF